MLYNYCCCCRASPSPSAFAFRYCCRFFYYFYVLFLTFLFFCCIFFMIFFAPPSPFYSVDLCSFYWQNVSEWLLLMLLLLLTLTQNLIICRHSRGNYKNSLRPVCCTQIHRYRYRYKIVSATKVAEPQLKMNIKQDSP